MSAKTKQIIGAVVAASLVTFASGNLATAQQPVVVNTVTPAVVGYTAEPAGLLGFRTRYRPVVTPVATQVAVTPVPVVQRATVVPPPARTVRYYAPPVVQTYYAPATVLVPVNYLQY